VLLIVRASDEPQIHERLSGDPWSISGYPAVRWCGEASTGTVAFYLFADTIDRASMIPRLQVTRASTPPSRVACVGWTSWKPRASRTLILGTLSRMFASPFAQAIYECRH